MNPGQLIEQARDLAGLERAELAERLRVSPHDIEIWETTESATMTELVAAINACGLDIHVRLAAMDSRPARLLDYHAALDDEQRRTLLDSLDAFTRMLRLGGAPLKPPRAPDPYRLFEALSRGRVRFVVLGEFAEAIHGLPLRHADIVVAPRPNLESIRRLERVLESLGATEVVPDGPMPRRGTRWSDWVTPHGPLRVLFPMASVETWDALERSALRVQVGDLRLRCADLVSLLCEQLDHGYEGDEPPLLTRLRDALLDDRA